MKPRDEQKMPRIYEATLRLVARVGLSGITMQMIAQEAGLSIGALYTYFKSKEELIDALYLESKKKTFLQYFDGVDSAGPIKTAFKKLWINVLNHRINHHEVAVFSEQYYYSPYLKGESRAQSDAMLAAAIELMERGKQEQLIKDRDSLLLLTFVMGGIVELSNLIRLQKIPLTQAWIDDAFQMAWDGIKA